MTTRRPQGPRFAASALAFALFASACAGGSASDTTVTAAADDAAPAAAVQEPEPAQEPAEAPEATQDLQGDTSITVPVEGTDEAPEAGPAATAVPPAPTAVPPTPEPAVTDESPAATVALPAVEVVDLVSGETADLSTLAQPGVTLVWFWAPH